MQSFAEKVYAACKKIPKGKVATYKQLAEMLETKAYRAVGQALHNNPYAPAVPCHRVIASSGKLQGFAHGLKRKQQLLEAEGIIIANGKINLKKFGYKIRT